MQSAIVGFCFSITTVDALAVLSLSPPPPFPLASISINHSLATCGGKEKDLEIENELHACCVFILFFFSGVDKMKAVGELIELGRASCENLDQLGV